MADPLAAAIEVPDLRTRDSKHYRLPNGLTAKAIGKLRHFYRAGSWSDVDLRLTDRGGNVFRADQHAYVFEADAGGLAIWDYDSGKGIKFLFPSPPDLVEDRAAYWLRDEITWKLAPRKVGLKTTGTVTTRRGAKTYHFDAQMLGGLAPPTVDGDGNLSHPAFLIPRAFVEGADGSRWDCSVWRITGGQAEFDFDDSVLPDTALPYVIDPTTIIALGASADDGKATAGGPSFPPGNSPTASTTDTLLRVEKSNDILAFFPYNITVVLLRWDTSSIPPGSAISSAFLRVSPIAASSPQDSRDLTAEWYEPGTIGADDYVADSASTAHPGTPLANLVSPPASLDFELVGLDNISVSGYTGLRLHVSGNFTQQPLDVNYFEFAAIDHVSLAEPQLIVTYGEGTLPASYIQSMPGIESQVGV